MVHSIPIGLIMRDARKTIAAMSIALGILGSSLPANALESSAQPETDQASSLSGDAIAVPTANGDQLSPGNAATDMLNDWVDTLNAIPSVSTHVGSILAGDRNRSATLKDVVITYDVPSDIFLGGGDLSLTIRFDEMYFEGLRLADGLLLADNLEVAEALEVSVTFLPVVGKEQSSVDLADLAGSFDVEYTDLLIEGLTVPLSLQKSGESTSPSGFALAALNALRKVKISRAFIDRVTETRRFSAGDTSATTYENSFLIRFDDGRIAEYSVDNFQNTEVLDNNTVENTSKTDTTIDRIVFRGLDIAPLIALLGGSSTQDRDIILAREEISNLRFSAGTVTGSVKDILVEDIGVLNQDPLAILDLIDKDSAGDTVDEDQLARAAAAAIGTFNIGRVEIDGVEIQAGDNTGSLRRLQTRDLGGNGLGVLSLDGLFLQTSPNNHVNVGHFAIGDVGFPPLEALFALDEVDEPSMEQILAALPTMGKLVVSSVDITSEFWASGQPADPNGTTKPHNVSLSLLEVLQGGFISNVATRSALVVDGLNIQTPLLGDPELVKFLEKMDIPDVELNQAVSIQWDSETKDLHLNDLTVHMLGGGTMSLSLVLGNVPKTVFENPDMAQFAMASATFKSARLRISGAYLIDAFISNEAAKSQIPKEVLTEIFAETLSEELGTVAKTRFGKDLVRAFGAFLLDPDELVVKLSPETPVAMTELLGLYVTNPDAIPARLGASVFPAGE
ncbi:hypothetical protein [Roseibium algae]|uniref:Uncharacterized protein n=1 Tax=Roseibium algae TaxID=3123038 RepID=A0ABU8TM66_9HYPH